MLWVGWSCLTGLQGLTFLIIVRFVLGLSLGCPLSVVFIVALYVPWCRHLEALPAVKPQLHADNLKCSAERPGAFFGSARFTAEYVRAVGQGRAPW